MTHRDLNLVSMESQDPTLSNDTKFKPLCAMGAAKIIYDKAEWLPFYKLITIKPHTILFFPDRVGLINTSSEV